MKDYSVLDELIPKTQELHRAIFDKGYEQGKADALNRQPCEDVATAFQFGMALGFGEKHDETDRIIKAVTPKEKIGHWIDDADKIDARFGRHTYKCSECGKYAEYFVSGTGVWFNFIQPNFCPNCGARMVSE